jgi:predicted transposase YdaD
LAKQCLANSDSITKYRSPHYPAFQRTATIPQTARHGNVTLFIEQQHKNDESLALRMFDTYVRLREKRRVKTTGLAIYTGDAKDVNTYFDSCYGFKVSVEYNTFHLPSKTLEELRRDKRTFARIALAGRLSLDAGDDVAGREQGAWELLNTTSAQEYDDKQRTVILDFSKRIFRLKDPKISLELKEAYKMQTISPEEYVKRIRLEEAREEGWEKGRRELIRNFLANGVPMEVAAKSAGLPLEKVQELAR